MEQQQCIRVIIGEDQTDFARLSANCFTQYGFSVSTTPKDGQALFDRIITEQPDVVVMDVHMKNLDAIAVMERINQQQITPPLFVVTSAYDNPFVEHEVMRNGAAYFILRPFDLIQLARRISDLTGFVRCEQPLQVKSAEETVEGSVTRVLQQLGLPAHLKGYLYVREGIILAIKDRGILDSVTKTLYPTIAKKFNTTAVRVERGIRYVIEMAWQRGEADRLNGYFGYGIGNRLEKPTNNEFIATVADRISIAVRQKAE